jgi:DNA polymerase III subunit gamma/tau
MPEFQAVKETPVAVSELPADSQPGTAAPAGPSAPQKTAGPGQVPSLVKPLWAALLEPTSAGVAGPRTKGQPPAAAPGLGKTQASNILASLASHAAAVAPVPATKPSAADASAATNSASNVSGRGAVAGRPARPGTGANPSPGLAGENGAGTPAAESDEGAGVDPSTDDIFPSRPRPSFGLRLRLRLRP